MLYSVAYIFVFVCVCVCVCVFFLGLWRGGGGGYRFSFYFPAFCFFFTPHQTKVITFLLISVDARKRLRTQVGEGFREKCERI